MAKQTILYKTFESNGYELKYIDLGKAKGGAQSILTAVSASLMWTLMKIAGKNKAFKVIVEVTKKTPLELMGTQDKVETSLEKALKEFCERSAGFCVVAVGDLETTESDIIDYAKAGFTNLTDYLEISSCFIFFNLNGAIMSDDVRKMMLENIDYSTVKGLAIVWKEYYYSNTEEIDKQIAAAGATLTFRTKEPAYLVVKDSDYDTLTRNKYSVLRFKGESGYLELSSTEPTANEDESVYKITPDADGLFGFIDCNEQILADFDIKADWIDFSI